MTKYYCPKCKVYIVKEAVVNNHHTISFKNGITWFSTEHRVVAIIEKEENVHSND